VPAGRQRRQPPSDAGSQTATIPTVINQAAGFQKSSGGIQRIFSRRKPGWHKYQACAFQTGPLFQRIFAGLVGIPVQFFNHAPEYGFDKCIGNTASDTVTLSAKHITALIRAATQALTRTKLRRFRQFQYHRALPVVISSTTLMFRR
jgi:hypothetical protein